jgi:hypothetical protein
MLVQPLPSSGIPRKPLASQDTGDTASVSVTAGAGEYVWGVMIKAKSAAAGAVLTVTDESGTEDYALNSGDRLSLPGMWIGAPAGAVSATFVGGGSGAWVKLYYHKIPIQP